VCARGDDGGRFQADGEAGEVWVKGRAGRIKL
jgi:hypothetical protein